MKSLKLLRKGKSVKAKKMYSRITIQCEQMQQTNDEDLTIQFSANGLPKVRLYIYYIIYWVMVFVV